MAEKAAGGSSPARRRAILDAAAFLFIRQGVRATTMEAIASEAGIAKPTLYGYFRDKDAVGLAALEALIAKLEASFLAALGEEGSVVERVAAALANKHKAVLRIMAGSRHAAELYSEQSRLAGPAFAALEARIETAIVRELEIAGVERARPLTQILAASASGIGHRAKSVAEVGPAIRLLVERLLGPSLP